jgi:hypothetical protein
MPWEQYPCRLGGVPAEIRVDLDAGAPDPTRPHLLYVWLDPTASAAEDLLTPAIEGIGAKLVGVISTAARFELYFYAPSPEGFAEAVGGAVGDLPIDVTMGSHPDSAWSHYFDVLLPAPDPEVIPPA